MTVFSGLQVIDFTTTISGPYCTRLLCELGATVIKIESADGDVMRTRVPLRSGSSAAFGQLNAGKASVVIDLRSEEGRSNVLQLIQQADVLVENFRPGVMSRLGMDYTAAKALNEQIIYCSISGYGQSGPSSPIPAYAPLVHATSGYDTAQASYSAAGTAPGRCGIFTADILAGTYAFGAIGAALHARGRSGRGHHIDVSMMECMLSLLSNELQAIAFDVPSSLLPWYGPVRTSDGFLVAAPVTEKAFEALVNAIGKPELVSDSRFSQFTPRRANWSLLMELVEQWSIQFRTNDCIGILSKAGVPCARYRSVDQALADPQMSVRNALYKCADSGGTFDVLRAPFRMSEVDAPIGSRAPALGEDSDRILNRLATQRGGV
jgi:CoA:oxalate CoA-transferase